jgi:putative endonuclease
MYFVYILYSDKCDRYYIGFCQELEARLERHNRGAVTATRNCKPYMLKASKAFATQLEARREELRLKKQKSRKYLEQLIQGNWQTRSNASIGSNPVRAVLLLNLYCYFMTRQGRDRFGSTSRLLPVKALSTSCLLRAFFKPRCRYTNFLHTSAKLSGMGVLTT